MPVVSIALVLGAAGVFIALTRSSWPAGWWFTGFALGLIGVYLAASRFSGLTVAGAVVVGGLLSLLALGHLGIESIRTAHLADARSTATVLEAELRDPATSSAAPAGRPATTPSPDSVLKVVAALCQVAEGQLVTVRGANTCQVRTLASTTPDARELAMDAAVANLAVARYQAAALSAPTSAALDRVATAEKQVASAVEPPPSVSIASAISAGANAVISSVPGSADIPIALQAAGWLVLALVGLLVIRLLSLRNTTYALGPVGVDPPSGSDAANTAETESFRTYLLHNLPEPGAVPGGQALTAMTDIAGAVPGEATGITAAVKAVAAAISVPHGYQVQYRDLAPLPAAGAPSTGIVVRIKAVVSSKLIEQKVFRGEDRIALVRSGAYWAAARIIEMSRSVPPWARWDAATSSTLADYYRADDDAEPGDISNLRTAVGYAPTSGLLLLELSQQEAMEGDVLAAFTWALQAATLYPRYLNARYRLAVSASMLSAQPDPLTPPGTRFAPGVSDRDKRVARAAGKAALIDAVVRFGKATGTGDRVVSDLARALQSEQGMEGALCDLAGHELDVGRRLTWWPYVAWNALRADERRFWWIYLTSWRRPKDRRLIAWSCWLVVSARRPPAELSPWARAKGWIFNTLYRPDSSLDQVMGPAAPSLVRSGAFARVAHYSRVTSQLGQDWQVAYNLACFWSVLSKPLVPPPPPPGGGDADPPPADPLITQLQNMVMDLLETAVLSRNSFQLTARWLANDPDLEPLDGNGRFEALRAMLPAITSPN